MQTEILSVALRCIALALCAMNVIIGSIKIKKTLVLSITLKYFIPAVLWFATAYILYGGTLITDPISAMFLIFAVLASNYLLNPEQFKPNSYDRLDDRDKEMLKSKQIYPKLYYRYRSLSEIPTTELLREVEKREEVDHIIKGTNYNQTKVANIIRVNNGKVPDDLDELLKMDTTKLNEYLDKSGGNEDSNKPDDNK